jgi:putative tricarboxylic transport membrane protein
MTQVRNLRDKQKDTGMKHVRHIIKAVAAFSAMLASAPANAAWEPTKPVEIVVAAGAGGASDQMARMMQAAIQKNNLMKQPCAG